MLSGLKINEEVNLGNIVINPFNLGQLNPNSYNLRLGNKLYVYKDLILDCRKQHNIEEIEIPSSGYILTRGKIYLGYTFEWTETPKHIPFLEGRSSLGRLGLDIHATAGFGDIGFRGHWTLELSVKQPLRIYPLMQICQIGYHNIEGPYESYSGKYQDSKSVLASQLFKEVSLLED